MLCVCVWEEEDDQQLILVYLIKDGKNDRKFDKND